MKLFPDEFILIGLQIRRIGLYGSYIFEITLFNYSFFYDFGEQSRKSFCYVLMYSENSWNIISVE